MSKKVSLFIVIFLVCLNATAWHEVFVLAAPRYLEVSFLSVGQGDSEFIQTPQGHQILIDGGPNSKVLEKLSSLMPSWDKSIDLVILTHPDKDHVTGLLDVLQIYKVDYFLWTGVIKNNAENQKLALLLEEASAPQDSFLASLTGSSPTRILTAVSGQRIRAGNVLIDILHPFENLSGQELSASVNDTSVVNKIIYEETSFLFTGDISSKIEKEIVNSGEDILADVLKAPHHGSKYSTSDLFLKNVDPDIAVIEVGKNSYGHPTPDVLQRLNNFGIKIFRTDVNGDIKMISDGSKIIINK